LILRSIGGQRALAGRADGWKAGQKQGMQDGYHLGRCEAIRILTPPAAVAVKPLRVLYIPQGFHSIDQGIIRALQQQTSELTTGTPQEMQMLAERVRPDLVLVLNGMHVFPENHLQQIDAIRALGIRTAIWFADDPYFTDQTVRIALHYDVVLTHEQSCVTLYRENGCQQVYYLPLAVDPELFRPQQVEPRYRTDVLFIGTAFWNRVELFNRIAPYLASKKFLLVGGSWDRLSEANYKLLRHGIVDGVPFEETVKYYAGAKIVINLHRDALHGTDNQNHLAISGQSINPRTYEMAACGPMQLTDIRDDLSRHYSPGHEIAVYRTPEELMRHIDYYLIHEHERREIAYNGLKRTLKQHTYLLRVEEMLRQLGY
jgi:spore maturation protein CgeB